MAYMERISRWIKANIESRLTVIDKLLDLFFISHLRDQAARFEFVKKCNFGLLLFCLVMFYNNIVY